MFNRKSFALLIVVMAIMALALPFGVSAQGTVMVDALIEVGGTNVVRFVVSDSGCGVFPPNNATITLNGANQFVVSGAKYTAGTPVGTVSDISQPFSSAQSAAGGGMVAATHNFAQVFPVAGTPYNGMWFPAVTAIDVSGTINATQIRLFVNSAGCWIGMTGALEFTSGQAFSLWGGAFTPGNPNSVTGIVGPFSSAQSAAAGGGMVSPEHSFAVTLPETSFNPDVNLVGILWQSSGGQGGMMNPATPTPAGGNMMNPVLAPTITATPVTSNNPADCLTRDVAVVDMVTITLKNGCALSGDFTHINGVLTNPALDSIASTGRFLINESGADMVVTMWSDGGTNIADANLAAAGYAQDRIANMLDVLPNCQPATNACERGVQVFRYPATGNPTVRWER